MPVSRRFAVLALALSAMAARPVFADAEIPRDSINYISGGLMSSHRELKINLETGDYRLVEPRNGGFTSLETKQGRLPADRLRNIRNLAVDIAKSGFKTPECLRVEAEEIRRNQLMQKRHILPPPPQLSFADSQVQFWVTVAGRTESSPMDGSCWTAGAKALYEDMFEAARADPGS